MSWQAFFPDSVRVADRWLCDVTVFNGTEKFVISVTYDHSVEECLPQLRAAVAKRDAQTLKPSSPIASGTVVDLTEAPVAVTEVPSKDEQLRQQWLAEKADLDTQLALARYPLLFAARYNPDWGPIR